MPFLKSKWKFLILIVTVISISLAIGFRANLMKIFISFSLLSIYYFPGILRLKFIKTIHLILFLGPVILFGLGVSGAFNIFSLIEKDIDSFTTTTNRDKQISFTKTRNPHLSLYRSPGTDWDLFKIGS